MIIKKNIITAITTGCLMLSSSAYAAGYSTGLTSTSALANSYAGSAAGIHDASDMFYNPAIISNINENQFVASFSYLDLDIDVDNLKKNGINQAGTEISDAGEDGLIPAFYYSTKLNDQIALGLALTVPFGLATKYNDNWGAKDAIIESKIETYNFNPNISYKINNDIAVAFGVQAQYIKNAIISYSSSLSNTTKINGQDWGYGYNLGLNYNINDSIKFGIGYRSKIDHKIDGKFRTNGSQSRAEYKLTTPESLTTGVSYQFDDKIELAFDATWNRWSRLSNIIFLIGGNSDDNVYDLSDSFIYSLGANYDYNNKLKLRSGLAYEKEGVTDNYRHFAIPTGDRVWTSIGFNYQLQNDFALDLSYLHQFHSKETINSVNNSGYSADIKTNVNVLSFGIKKNF